MAKPRKVIITCAVTGAIHTPSMSPHLPITPEEIADAAIGAAEAGAAVVDANALRILDQEIRDADKAQGKARDDLAGLVARRRILETEVESFRAQAAKYEASARIAVEKGNMDLARQVAQRIADLEQDIALKSPQVEDMRAAEEQINDFPQFMVTVDGVPIHFVHVRGKGPDPKPLILTHGWPWTFWDWHQVIGPLTDPAAHGGDPADSFDVVIPSLPGAGFSVPLTTPGLGARRIAELWHTLMTEVLGYARYGAGVGDW